MIDLTVMKALLCKLFCEDTRAIRMCRNDDVKTEHYVPMTDHKNTRVFNPKRKAH